MWELFPDALATPDAVCLEIGITPADAEARALVAAGLNESFLVRLVAEGQPPGSILNRLFDEQLAGARFDEASSIIWTVAVRADADGVVVELTGSGAWLGPLRGQDPWTSQARPDAVDDDDDP